MKQKTFIPVTPTHNYQKGIDGNRLFYCDSDRLVYFTIYCTEAKRREVRVLALNLMFTHTHALLQTRNKTVQSCFNKEVERLYAREFNENSSRQGPVFMKTYGWAQKRNSAKVRSCLAYIGNNHVEKKLRSEEGSMNDGVSFPMPSVTTLFRNRSSSVVPPQG